MVMVILACAFAPFAQAQSSTVPACCRTGGRHHCNGSMETPGSSGFKSAPEKCPYRRTPAVTSEVVALTLSGHCIDIFVVDSENARPLVVVPYSSAHNDAHKRGPPAA